VSSPSYSTEKEQCQYLNSMGNCAVEKCSSERSFMLCANQLHNSIFP